MRKGAGIGTKVGNPSILHLIAPAYLLIGSELLAYAPSSPIATTKLDKRFCGQLFILS